MTQARPFARRRSLAALLLTAMPGALMAAAPACHLPDHIDFPTALGPVDTGKAVDIPSRLYKLAISWAPEYCATGEGMGGAFDRSIECDRKANRFGFILHGLWPDGDGKTWPQFCRAAQPLDPALIRKHLCATPLPDLMQHEWAKHGTCGWPSPEVYFRESNALYARLRFPDAEALSRESGLTVGAFARAFAAANAGRVKGLDARTVTVATSKDGYLQEVRLCLDARKRFAACSAEELKPADLAKPLRVRRGD